MSPSLEPDVAFGTIPDVGVVAAVTDDRPSFLDETLRRHGFTYSSQRDVYLLPSGTDHHTAVQTVAVTTRQFQEAGWSVAADPRLAVPPARTSADVDGPVPGVTLKELTAGLPGLDHPSDVADWMVYPAHEQVGVLPQVQRFLRAAADWCDQYDHPETPDLARHLRDIAGDVGLASVRLINAALDLDDLPAPTPERGQAADRTYAEHTARAQAATASSPHRATAPTKPAATEPSPPAAAPPAARRHR